MESGHIGAYNVWLSLSLMGQGGPLVHLHNTTKLEVAVRTEFFIPLYPPELCREMLYR